MNWFLLVFYGICMLSFLYGFWTYSGIPPFLDGIISAIIGFFMCVIMLILVGSSYEDKKYELRTRKEMEDNKILNEIKDENGRLHSLTEPAVVHKSGNVKYYIEGVWFWDKVLWNKVATGKLSIDECLQLDNIETRRIAIKYCITPEKFLDNWREVRLVNKDKRGNWLYEYTNEKLTEPIKILVYKDPSTERTYYSFVPPDMTNATRAMAWKFQLTEQEYNNLRFEA